MMWWPWAKPSNTSAATTALVLRELQTLNEQVRQMALDFAAFDADLASLKQEVSTVAALITSANQAMADKAADAAALVQREAEIKALRDQLASLTIPAA